jgi:hypothetical protein
MEPYDEVDAAYADAPDLTAEQEDELICVLVRRGWPYLTVIDPAEDVN